LSARILVIEDHPLSRELVVDLLEPEGYEVLQAQTAEEGMRLAREQRPDLILMDFRLPGMNGVDAARSLKTDPATKKIPVILLTAHVLGRREELELLESCAGYVSKPLDVRTFPTAIAGFLRQARAGD
jgi:two-component system, cell cycle response regulator DivK